MRIIHIEETVRHGGQLRFHHLTDLHVGAPDFDEPALKARVAQIEADDDARWTMGGDGADLIRFNDRRYQPTELAPRYRQATDIRYASLEHLEELLSPIADKCLGWADGNHEEKIDNVYGSHFGVEMCCNLGIPKRYVGYRGFVHVTFTILPRKAVVSQLIDLQHGWQSGRSSGAFVNQAEKELSMTEADIVLRGHSHKPADHTLVTLGVTRDCERTVQRHRTAINGGTWRRGYRDDLAPVNPNRLSEVEKDLWGETKGFRAERVGGAVLVLGFQQGYGSKPMSSRHPAGVESRAAHVTHSVVSGDVAGVLAA